MKKEWQILRPDPHSVEKLCRELNCHPAFAATLINRNIVSAKDASKFISTSLDQMSPPFSIKDMDTAVNRILEALKRREKILIFGDYDVDGITATTILLEFLRSIGADVSFYIPHRIKEGYGLQPNHITNVALSKKVTLIITVDCGSAGHDAVKAANADGIDVIITDHHIISDTIPPAVAVVNPKRPDCTSGFDFLAGVGVAFYLLICLRKKLRDRHFWQNRPEPNLKSICDLVALGTLADMVPLVAENRILTKTGIDIIRSNRRPGLNALLETCGINKTTVDGDDMIFGLSPRLNAAGRIAHASIAVELLTIKKNKAAEQIALSLNSMNQKRREIENETFVQIQNHINRNPDLLKKRTLVLAHNNWHLGILGIVAARVMKKYYRPVVLITTSAETGKGSARSIPGINLYEGLLSCSDILENFGGHPMAAGLEINPGKIDQFRSDFENTIGRMAKKEDFIRKITIDYELDFVDISKDLIDQLESLKPFGTHNDEPIFVSRNVKVVSSKIVGNNHRRMRLKQSSSKAGKNINAIQFNAETNKPLKNSFNQIAFRLRWNHWNGKKTAQMVVEET